MVFIGDVLQNPTREGGPVSFSGNSSILWDPENSLDLRELPV
jgi:hypothetical protein